MTAFASATNDCGNGAPAGNMDKVKDCPLN
jgi:hypothetical protein